MSQRFNLELMHGVGEWEGKILSGRGIEKKENKMDIRIFGSDGRLVEQNLKLIHARQVPVKNVGDGESSQD